MPIEKLILICIVFASVLLGSVLAADKPSAQADMDKLQEQVRTLDKELAVQREAFVRKLNDVEKRQSEITAQQANSLAVIANQTATVGNHITNTSILITVLVLGAGFITYFSAKGRAEKEAREASSIWFDENAIKLTSQIEALQAETANAIARMKNQVVQVETSGADAKESISASMATAILSISKASPTGESTPVADPQSVEVVTKASQSLKSKSESQFTANDFLARGLSYYFNRDFHAALSAFDDALLLSDSQFLHEFGAQLLVIKGSTLNKLDKSVEAIAVFDELKQRFGSDPRPEVRDLVANGVINKGFIFHQLERFVEAIAVYDDLDQVYGVDMSLAVREVTARGLFYKSASLIQLNKSTEAIAVFDELYRRFSTEESTAIHELVVMTVLNKGLILGKMDKPDDAIAVYELLEQRFGSDTNPVVREQVAEGLSEAGFNQILLAKKNWGDCTKRLSYLNLANGGLQRASLKLGDEIRAEVLGNLGYCLFLEGNSQSAKASTLECLALGGQKSLDEQRKIATLHRVEPEDSHYEELLNKLWVSLPPPPVKS